jgi:hypothetical protein
MFLNARKLAKVKTHSLAQMEAKAIDEFRTWVGYRWYRRDGGPWIHARREAEAHARAAGYPLTRVYLGGGDTIARRALQDLRAIRAEMARRAAAAPVPTPRHGKGVVCPLRPASLVERRIA